jgi:hypothetical protein
MHLGKFVVLTVLAVSLVALGADAASAQRGKRKGTKQKAQMKAVDQALINELNATKELLKKANHDYKGHRVAAIKQIRQAVHQLRLEINPRATMNTTLAKAPAGNAGKNPNPVKEPQAVSDAQLTKAMNNLGTILNQLNNIRVTTRRTNAAGNIQNAINELKKALAVN